VIASVNANGFTTTQVYDAIGQRIAVVDANGHRSSFSFDPAGRRVGMSDALGNLTTWGYDVASRQTLRIDGRGLATTYVYDNASRQTGIQYQNGQRATMVYDANSQRTVLSDWTGSYTSAFDPDGRLSSVVNPAGIALTYAYNAISLRATMNQPTGLFTYAYDPASRISTLINPEGQTTSFAYDANSRVTANFLANGVNASWSYDSAGQILLLANVNSTGTTLSNFNYTYNHVGNRTQVVEVDGSTVSWSYDPTYQLTNEQRSGANAYNITYSYDPVGNRLLLESSGAITTYAYNAANELATSQTSAGTTTYTFDGCGNQLITQAPGNQLTTNTWDGENRLTHVASPSGILDTFTYNGHGLRVQKQDSTGTTNHIWDERNVVLETNATNGVQVAYTLEPVLFGNLISQSRGGADSFFLFDAQGSTRQLASSGGSVTDGYVYDSFGNRLTSTGETSNSFLYLGRFGYYFDSDLAKFYVRTRTLDPTAGRFLSIDPLLMLDGKARVAIYSYVSSDPANRTDASGLQGILPGPRLPPKPVFPAPGAPPTDPSGNTTTLLGFNLCCFTPPSKKKRLRPIGGVERKRDKSTGTGSGYHQFFPLGGKGLIGTGGCAGCIAVIIKCDSGLAVYHFTAGDDPEGSLGEFMWVLDHCHAIVCGGDNSRDSNCLASYVIAALNRSGVPIDGISGASGCGYDQDTDKWYESPWAPE
jgi:RHS repeat-associated protein